MRLWMTALATAGALGLALPAASAQGVYLEGPGVSVGVGERGYDRDRDYRRDRDWDRRDRRGTTAYGGSDCRVIERQRERRDGSVEIRRERVCD